MKLLLDSHLLLWVGFQSKRVPRAARSMIEDAGNELFFSAASIWEIAIKQGRGRGDLNAALLVKGLLENGYQELAVGSRQALAAVELPPIHGDPFDRILIAQATVGGMTLLTSDATVALYPGPILKV